MSQKEIHLYDDSVIKLTIKQGKEAERFSVNQTANGVYGNFSIDILDYDNISSIPGSFSTGELAYTRDTNRLFIGNLSEDLRNSQQQTLGGVLSGNKYLGYIDSRKTASEIAVDEEPGKGKDIASILSDNITDGSPSYRSYNFENTDGSLIITPDKKWSRLPYYNATYDAYDGDYMYDFYRNALILFDHNIKKNDGTTYNSPTIGGKRKTPLQARFTSEDLENPDKKYIHEYTNDMYGDGYVLLYNVIPDGDTLTFVNKSFDKDGQSNNPNDPVANYSYNVMRVNRVPTQSILNSLDNYYFKQVGDKISLNPEVLGNSESIINIQKYPNSSHILYNNASTGFIEQSTIQHEELVSALSGFVGTDGYNGSIKEYIDNAISSGDGGNNDSGNNNSNPLIDNLLEQINNLSSEIDNLKNNISTNNIVIPEYENASELSSLQEGDLENRIEKLDTGYRILSNIHYKPSNTSTSAIIEENEDIGESGGEVDGYGDYWLIATDVNTTKKTVSLAITHYSEEGEEGPTSTLKFVGNGFQLPFNKNDEVEVTFSGDDIKLYYIPVRGDSNTGGFEGAEDDDPNAD